MLNNKIFNNIEIIPNNKHNNIITSDNELSIINYSARNHIKVTKKISSREGVS